MDSSLTEKTLDKEFREYCQRNSIFRTGDRILLAVSGGIDSVAMLHLFMKSSIIFSVVHCNFMLRATDSDEDEIFVRNLCDRNSIPFYSRSFDTNRYAEENKLSVQVAARDLRYAYFEELRKQLQYEWIAVAHNSDDAIETFFINLLRGTGIQGLTGIKIKSGKIIRPLLFASRENIEEYARETGLLYRLDKSNLSNKYARNKIRLELIPLINSMAPGFRQTMQELMQNLGGVAAIYKSYVSSKETALLSVNEDCTEIDISRLRSEPFYEALLPEILRSFGFSMSISRNILRNLDSESGKVFLSSSHRIVKDRNKLIILKHNSEPDEIFYIDRETSALEIPLLFKICQQTKSSDYVIPADPLIACLDADKLVFPLILRHWKSGDYFKPLGMDQMKKLSDYFINEKLSLVEKERLWLLVSDGKIAWICGHRIDDRFKITTTTKNIAQFQVFD